MSEIPQAVQDTPAAAAATMEPNAATTTASEATADPIRSQETSELSPESRPELGSGLIDGTTAAAPTAPNVTNVPKEEKVGKGEVMVESHPINEGILNYKGPGLKGLIFTKKHFWFNDAPLEHKHLTAYLGNEKSKDIAHPNAAHAQQTGKGLLFFAKRAEDKDHPQGIFNLADITDVVKGNFNDFGFSLHGHKHNFQAVTKAEKDGWIVALETKQADAKTSREGIVGSSGYKSALEKYGAPAGAATTGTSRSLSRPGKKASKSRERKAVSNKTDDTAAATTIVDTNDSTPAGVTAENTSAPVTDHTAGTKTGTETGEAAIGGAAVGAAAGATAGRTGSTSEEDKKTKKSRSQSRNKRGSLFGSLLGKKEDNETKKEIKKEEKEEKKEEKAELKAEKKEEKLEKKAEKKELKEEAKEEKSLEKEGNPETTGETHGFNAHAIAARVIGEPVVPPSGPSIGTDEVAPVAGAGTTAPEGIAAEGTPTSATRETAPKPNKRASIFGGLFGKKEAAAAAAPASTEAAPAVPAKDEPSAVPSTAPQLDNPVTERTTEPAAQTAATETPAMATESTTPGATTTPTDKRRSSFFSNLGTKKERKAGATSGDEMTDGEGKKQSSGGLGGLLRKASRAQKGSSGAKDAADVPFPNETPAAAAVTTDGAADGMSGLAEGEVGSNGMAESHEQTPVSAAA